MIPPLPLEASGIHPAGLQKDVTTELWIPPSRTPPAAEGQPRACAVQLYRQWHDGLTFVRNQPDGINVMSFMKPRKPPSALLDAVDRRLVLALSADGRQAASGLARKLGLSRQAVAGRLRALEQRAVIRGYRADVDPAALDLTVRAQIRLSLDGAAPAGKEREVLKRLTASPFVRSVYRVSGEDCLLVFVVCRSIADVNTLLATLQATRAIQSSRTSFVLETVLEKAPLGPLDASLAGE